MRHDAIFKEIQHYSWLLSVFLGSPVALLFAKDWEKDRSMIKSLLPYLWTFPALGIVFSFIAFFVIRREYHLYNESEARLLYIERALGLTSEQGFRDGRLSKAARGDFTVADYAMTERGLGSVLPWKARIRTLFMAGFLVFAGLAAAQIIVSLQLFV